jgi:hypothetical protein
LFYFKKSPELSRMRRIAMVVLCVFMSAIQLVGSFGPPPASVKGLAVSGFVIYLLFTGLAAWAEGRQTKASSA